MDEILKIVPMSAEHIDALAELERRCFAEPWSPEALRQELDNPCANFLVAVRGGKTTGYIGLFIAEDDCSVANIAVSPELRRLGTARALLTESLRLARERGCRYVTLEVRRSNKAAAALYESCGFVCAGVRRGFYRKPDEDALVMTNTLSFGDDRQ